MRFIELAPGVRSSVLGFGCAPIMGSVGKSDADRAIGCALDAGINHFDVARSYGFGEAENFVGRRLKSVRDRVCIATKFGIVATWQSRLLSPVKPLLRTYKRLKKKQHPVQSGSSTQTVRNSKAASTFLKHVRITPAEMRLSLERSLRALKTDFVDYYFLHDPCTEDWQIDGTIQAMEDLKRAGKIRAFGIASLDVLQPAIYGVLQNIDVIQMSVAQADASPQEITDFTNRRGSILFSPFSNQGSNREQILPQLSSKYENSVILCSMFRPEHIQQNVVSLG